MMLPFITRLIPVADREAILGDLFEEAEFRTLRGSRRHAWLARECAAIALGLSVERVRAGLVMPPAREVLAGLALDGRSVLRHGGAGTLVRLLVFAGSIATIVLGVELLVGTLMSAAGI